MNRSRLQMPEGIERDESTYSTIYGKFVLEPLERGFGVTLGNAFRRVLLSSLHGAAITHIRFDNVLHEYSTIPGIVEDVSEIILNLKQVWIKLLNKRPDKIVVDLKGPGVFTAGDIEKHSPDIEILNPDLHIATLNDDADTKIEIRISRGRGYVPAEENKIPDQPLDTITLDAVFNPIRKVKYVIENTRVDEKIDFERLILEVHTNGSVTPDDALTYAGNILKEHVSLFISFDVEPEDEDEGPQIDEEVLRIRKLLKMSVEELELSVRSHNCLKSANIKTIGDLVGRDEGEMLRFRNFGRKSLQELSKIMEEKGLHFGIDVDKYLKSDAD